MMDAVAAVRWNLVGLRYDGLDYADCLNATPIASPMCFPVWHFCGRMMAGVCQLSGE